MEGSLRYAVLLKERAALKPAALAQAVAAFRRCPAVDLAAPMRRCWGIVEQDADEPGARREAQALCAAGLPALAVPANLIEELPAAQVVRALGVDSGPAKLLAAAAFTQRQSRVVRVEEGPGAGRRALQLGLSMATGMPLNLFGGGKKEVEKTLSSSELLFYLDVYLSEPPRRLRVNAQDFDFSCLGERKGYDAAGNFRRLLESKAPLAAALNVGARGLLDGRPVRELGYESLDDLEREARWLLTLIALKV